MLLVIVVNVRVPNHDCLVITTGRYDKCIIGCELDTRDMTAVSIVVIEAGLFFDAWVLEELHLPEVIASSQ